MGFGSVPSSVSTKSEIPGPFTTPSAIPELVIITDPGPDPDDVKAILMAAVEHQQGRCTLCAVIANGGHQALERAKLAKAVLNWINCDVPVGIGENIKEYQPRPHEYEMAGWSEISQEELMPGAELLKSTFERARDGNLTVLCISGNTDFANLIDSDPELVLQKVKQVSVMGGLEKTSEGKWVPDQAVNNLFDAEAAEKVYSFCMDQCVHMCVVSRKAVPNIPMGIAKEFATQFPEDSVMGYLVQCQFKGLEGLWERLCKGELPERCTKEWYFTTFCGVGKEEYEEHAFIYSNLGEKDQISAFLNGTVKPYDVMTLMTCLPKCADCFGYNKASVVIKGKQHYFFNEEEHMIDAEAIIHNLRHTFLVNVFAAAPEQFKVMDR